MWVMTALTSTGCLEFGHEHQVIPNPNDDRFWSMRVEGVNMTSSRYLEVFARIPSGRYSFLSEQEVNPICTAIDGDGDGFHDDSLLELIEFTDASITMKTAIYLDNTKCDGGYNDYDYADQVEADYSIASSEFQFDRIDLLVTDIARHVNSSAGAYALSTLPSVCNLPLWQPGSVYSFENMECIGASDTMYGVFNPLTVALPGIGDVLEGVLIYSQDMVTLALSEEGNRPSEDDIAMPVELGLSGGPIYAK
ncbi:hypothetical protein NBRC116188_14990 [Oceaniserpentilla sp. 4NH20-0058]